VHQEPEFQIFPLLQLFPDNRIGLGDIFWFFLAMGHNSKDYENTNQENLVHQSKNLIISNIKLLSGDEFRKLKEGDFPATVNPGLRCTKK
jgi:hypothetical protein